MTELHPSGDRIMWYVKKNDGPVTLDITVHKETAAAISATINPRSEGSWKKAFLEKEKVSGEIRHNLDRLLDQSGNYTKAAFLFGIKAFSLLPKKAFVRMAIRQNEIIVPARLKNRILNKKNGDQNGSFTDLDVLVAPESQEAIHHFSLWVQS